MQVKKGRLQHLTIYIYIYIYIYIERERERESERKREENYKHSYGVINKKMHIENKALLRQFSTFVTDIMH